MSKFNFQIFMNAYSDKASSNTPSLNNFRWTRNINGLAVQKAISDSFSLASGESRVLFSGLRTLAQNNTTQYSLSLKPLTSNTYILNAVNAALPNFRTPRNISSDSSTSVTVTQNGPLMILSAPGIAAFFTGTVAGITTPVTITANNVGLAGNSVSLSFDGSTTISAEIIAWNIANPSNQVSLTSGDGTQIPTSGDTIALAGGASALSLISGGVTVGDYVRIGSEFDPNSQVFSVGNLGEFKVLAFTDTSITVENEAVQPEGPIVLGSDFANQIQVYSAAGVQVGDIIDITGGFSIVTQNSYQITAVAANYLEFYSTDVLPTESNVVTEAIAIYYSAKSFVYIEADQECDFTINGIDGTTVKPLVCCNTTLPGILVRTDDIYSLSVTNNSTDVANIYLAAIE